MGLFAFKYLPLAMLGLAALAKADDNSLLPPPDIVEELERENGVRPAERAPATAEEAGKTTAATPKAVRSSHNAFFEVAPALGIIGVHHKSAFTFGSNFAMNITPGQSIPLYLEPGFLVSLLPGDNNMSTTLYHLDMGMRFDVQIGYSPVAPFIKAAIGSTFSSSKDVVVYGNTIPRSYLNIYAGAGVLGRLASGLVARGDVGATLQDGTISAYGLGSIMVLF
jgi:hypothetical protein